MLRFAHALPAAVALMVCAGPVPAATITVTAPNGGEVWAADTPHRIDWDAGGLLPDYRYVDVTLLRDGVPIQLIVRSSGVASNTSYYDWTPCIFYGDDADYTIRVSCVGCDPPVEDVSNAPFSLTGCLPVPTLTLTSPQAGTTWTAGDATQITWTSTDPIGYVAAWLRRGGQRVHFLGQRPMDAGTLPVDVGAFLPPGNDYVVELEWLEYCGLPLEITSPPLTIAATLPVPTLAVTSPAGGETWPTDTVQSITWAATDPAGEVEVWLAWPPSGYEPLGTACAADGQLAWSISPCLAPGSEYTVRLRWRGDGQIVETASPAMFSIAVSHEPALAVVSPTEGAVWPAGTSQPITWSTDCANGTIGIELARSDGVYTPLAAVPAADATWTWDICPGLGDGPATVRLRLLGCSTEAVSDGFTITGSATPALTLLSPLGGDTWTAGGVYDVTWTATNLDRELWINLPNTGLHNSGDVFVPVWHRSPTGGPAASGSFAWPIPPALRWPPTSPPGNHGGAVIGPPWGSIAPVASGPIFAIVAGAPLPGDVDGNGAADLVDFALMQLCATGRGPHLMATPCDFFDQLDDADVDVDDLETVAGGLMGPPEEGGRP